MYYTDSWTWIVEGLVVLETVMLTMGARGVIAHVRAVRGK
jgi:hypothetical protein